MPCIATTYTYIYVYSHIDIAHLCHIYTHTCVIVSNGYWMYGKASISRLLKIRVSFSKEPYKRDDILQWRPVIVRSLLMVATP